MPPAFAPPAHLVRAPHPRCVCGSSPRRTRPVRLRTPPRRPATYAASDAASPDTPPLLEMRDISYRVPRNWDVRVFNQMNFSVRAGEFVIVIGENGAGKSTALNLMTGLVRVERGNGELYWRGKLTPPGRMLDHIGAVMQNPGQYFLCPTVLEELTLGREGKTPDDVRRVLAAVGLLDVSLMAPPTSLSGGQIRRLALAAQLMREPLPTLFVLDEPLAGVDWTARRDIVKLLGSLKSQFAIVIVSHEPGELLPYADRVVEVSRGGMHDIHQDIIRRAVRVRADRGARKKAKAMEDAARYMKDKSFGKPVS